MGDLSKIQLLSNASATGSPFEYPGGPGVFMVCGTFGGATVSLYVLGPDGLTYIPTGAAFTANNCIEFNLPHCFIQAEVTGGTPSGLYASAQRLSG
jgi:hypothetical protein